MASLLDAIRVAIEAEAMDYELKTGQGRAGGKDKFDERIGYSKGLRRALAIVMDQAKKVNNEEND